MGAGVCTVSLSVRQYLRIVDIAESKTFHASFYSPLLHYSLLRIVLDILGILTGQVYGNVIKKHPLTSKGFFSRTSPLANLQLYSCSFVVTGAEIMSQNEVSRR